jgi:transcriptional regulator with XRE-family HTH domain
MTTTTAAVAVAMTSAGQTAGSMAKASGIAATTLRRRLSGRSSFTVNELDAVAQVLGVPIVDLLGEPTR